MNKPKIQHRPRVCSFMLQTFKPRLGENDTWLEAEEFCYPGGGMRRRCRAMCEDGKLRIFRCGIPDTFFSIPTKPMGGKRGYLTNNDGTWRFIECKPEYKTMTAEQIYDDLKRIEQGRQS